MNMNSVESFVTRFGEPDIQLEAFRIWIHDRQFPDVVEFWDANWVNVTAHCEVPGASVWITGAFVHLSEIHEWMQRCRAGYQALSGDISLYTLEPDLKLNLQFTAGGKIIAAVEMQSGMLNKSDHYSLSFESDQTHLPQLIEGCEKVLKHFPLRGTPWVGSV